MKISLTQNRSTYCVRGEFVILTTRDKNAALKKFYESKIEFSDNCEDAEIYQLTSRVRVIRYPFDVAGVQTREGRIFKRWGTVKFLERVGDRKGNTGANNCCFEGRVMSFERAMQFGEALTLKLNDPEAAIQVL